MWNLQVLYCSDCSLFFQVSIFSSLIGFANLLFVFCVFRLVKNKLSGPQFFLLAGALPLGVAAESVLVVYFCKRN